MALIIDPQRVVDDNAFEFEHRLKSPASKFQEIPPTPVTYYHLADDETTADTGFLDVESILGNKSPLRFKKIFDFPISGLDQIVLQMEDGEAGLDTEFTSDAVINPGTLTPVPNSFFKIHHLNGNYLFRITEVNYDVLIPNGFYKISYKLHSVDEEQYHQIDRQLVGKYNCVAENIGTDKVSIIESFHYDLIKELYEMYDRICDIFLNLYYDETHDVLLFNEGLRYFYDPLATVFINKHGLLNTERTIKTYRLSEQFRDPMRKIKYERSIYRFMELRNVKGVQNFFFKILPIISDESSFVRWGRDDVYFLDPNITICETNATSAKKFLGDEFVIAIDEGRIVDFSSYAKVISTFLLKEDMAIEDIPKDLDSYMIDQNLNLEVFLLTPIVMYIVRQVIDNFMLSKK